MSDLTPAINAITRAVESDGLPELARRAGVPYTTVLDWQRVGWRPKAIRTFERLARAANTPSPQEAA